jgi:hypothetical protein
MLIAKDHGGKIPIGSSPTKCLPLGEFFSQPDTKTFVYFGYVVAAGPISAATYS